MSYLQMVRDRQLTESAAVRSDVLVSPAQLAALRLINLAGCRIIHADGIDQIGIWEDLDGPELRSAFRAVNMQGVPVIHLGPNVEMRYRIRSSAERKPGESFAQWRTRALGVTK